MQDDRKFWRRVQNFSRAEVVEWHRLLENPKLSSDIRRIQSDFGLPLPLLGDGPLFEDPTYVEWMGWEESNKARQAASIKRRLNFIRRVKRLLQKHGISTRYSGSLWGLLITGKTSPSYRTGGFPTFTYRRHRDGEWKHECIITPETDLGNPLILDNIRQWQMKCKAKPPRPTQTGRKKDWRPVWEWRNRNPDTSDRKIAEDLGISRVALSRAMEKLDKEHDTKMR